jgi:hemolysin III
MPGGYRNVLPVGSAAVEAPVPRLRGKIHQAAFFVSLPAAIALVLIARGAVATAVASIYATSLVALFGASAAYHVGRWSPRARVRMKSLDHSMIYVLIAGTYTPVTVLALRGPWEAVLLSIAWSGAAVGVALKLARPDEFGVATAVLYMALGWLAVVALPQLVDAMWLAGAVLMIAGGLLYTGGAIVLAWRRPDPRPATFGYHEVWHAFQVAAAACHFVMVALVVR